VTEQFGRRPLSFRENDKTESRVLAFFISVIQEGKRICGLALSETGTG
jgi:hypothetical protein